jgi:hypothetical protein
MLDNAIPVTYVLGGSFTHLAIWYSAILVHFTASRDLSVHGGSFSMRLPGSR